ncbi:MAG: hypothetical protein N4A47_04590 [Clostridia bacterium]|nr:hypothetical protein [Clostridia bacterium]
MGKSIEQECLEMEKELNEATEAFGVEVMEGIYPTISMEGDTTKIGVVSKSKKPLDKMKNFAVGFFGRELVDYVIYTKNDKGNVMVRDEQRIVHRDFSEIQKGMNELIK